MTSFMTASPMGSNIGMLASGSPAMPAVPSYHQPDAVSERETTDELQCSTGGGTGCKTSELVH